MNFLLSMESAVAEGVLWSLMAIGVFITFKIMNISDLTVDGTFALGAFISVSFLLKGTNPLLTVILGGVFGGIAGAITGILHTKLQIPAILSGILTMISIYSINMRILGKANVSIMNNYTTLFSAISESMGLSRDRAALLVGAIFVVVTVVALYWFFGTEIGCAIRATGNNESMAKALGVNTDNIKIMGLAVSNALVAISGALVAQYQRYVDVKMGTGTIIIGLASVVIGSIIVSDKGNFASILAGTVLGSAIYRVIMALVLKLGLDTNDLKLLTAVMVIISILLSRTAGYIGSLTPKKEANK